MVRLQSEWQNAKHPVCWSLACTNRVCTQHCEHVRLNKKKLTALTSTLKRSVSDAQVRSRPIMQKKEGAWATDV